MAGRFAPRPTRTTVRGGHVAVPGGVPRQAVVPGRTRTWTPPGPLDLGLVLGPLRRGPGDPTFRATPDGAVWRASRTPLGAGTLRVSLRDGVVRGEAWGPGSEWLLEQLPEMLGAADDPGVFEPRHRVVALARHRRPGLRLTRTGLVLESLIPSVLEQKVTTDEAYRAWRLLVRKFGEPAPGPAPERMSVMPAAAGLGVDSLLGVASGRGRQQAGVDDSAGRAGGWAARGGGGDGGGGCAGPVGVGVRDRAVDLGGDRAAQSRCGGFRDRRGSSSAGDRGVRAGGGP